MRGFLREILSKDKCLRPDMLIYTLNPLLPGVMDTMMWKLEAIERPMFWERQSSPALKQWS
jgi:hypothetical protein